MKGVFVAALALVFAAPAAAGGPSLVVGVAEDSPKQATLTAAKARVTMAQLAGVRQIRVTAQWRPGLTAPPDGELAALRNAADAGRLAGIRIVVTVYPFGSSVTPLTPAARAEFASYHRRGRARRLLRGDRRQRAEHQPLLDAAVRRRRLERGGDRLPAVAGRGVRRRQARRPDHGRLGPRRLAARLRQPRARAAHALADRASSATWAPSTARAAGRRRSWTALAIHPYGDNSSQGPKDSAHPNSTTIGIADYPKLVRLLGEAFDGTPQRGTTLPILYDEYGVETQIAADRASLYDGNEPDTTRPVDAATQARFYREAIEMTFCQPTVTGIFLFHLEDEKARAAWQSGLYDVAGRPRPAVETVRAAASAVRRGVAARCNLQLTPRVALRRLPDPTAVAVRFSSNLDASYRVRLLRENGTVAGSTSGRIVGGTQKVVRLRRPNVRAGLFRWEVTARSVANPAPAKPVLSSPFRLT